MQCYQQRTTGEASSWRSQQSAWILKQWQSAPPLFRPRCNRIPYALVYSNIKEALTYKLWRLVTCQGRLKSGFYPSMDRALPKSFVLFALLQISEPTTPGPAQESSLTNQAWIWKFRQHHCDDGLASKRRTVYKGLDQESNLWDGWKA
jgi:hypothetical protein